MPLRPVLGMVHVAPTPQRATTLKATSQSVQRNPDKDRRTLLLNPPERER